MEIDALVNLNAHAPSRTIKRQQENGRAPASALFDFTLKMHQLHSSIPSAIKMQDELNAQILPFAEIEEAHEPVAERTTAKEDPMLVNA